ncbi:guanylate-binding protein 6-like [Camelus ferus]|uniref:Guanylate-binding protein 6-like n=1 Tax=Camelus ferus TaxID=419612 RepID=A0A8B8U8D0_CAMFR|nr:guanylate-binding protein 6-like [Camelus ferus]
MASGPSMMNPVCLVERQNSQMTVNPDALKILNQISQPVVVVAIVGPYRTGKSYLMNRLLGQNHGFSLGSTVRAETKGFWMWCVPHPSKESHTLVLLDTEGLGDVEKGDSKIDSWTFTLAVLLSSCFVYNSMSTINHQALEQLHYVTELTNLIRTKSPCISDDGEDSVDFVSFFPDFVWAVRDFMLELEFDGHPITEDEYLENALRLIPGIRAWPGCWGGQEVMGSAEPCHPACDLSLYLRLDLCWVNNKCHGSSHYSCGKTPVVIKREKEEKPR